MTVYSFPSSATNDLPFSAVSLSTYVPAVRPSIITSSPFEVNEYPITLPSLSVISVSSAPDAVSSLIAEPSLVVIVSTAPFTSFSPVMSFLLMISAEDLLSFTIR